MDDEEKTCVVSAKYRKKLAKSKELTIIIFMNNNDIYSRDNLPVDRASNLLNELFRQRKFDDLSKDEKKVIFDTAVSALINIDSVFR